MRVLIIGQGLAGTLASHACLQRGWDVHVIDSGAHCASSVAAGMYNPMSFRRIVEVWDAQLHWDAMQATYADIEATLADTFLHPLPIRKRIPNADVADLWNSKSADIPWISKVTTLPNGDQVGTVNGGGWLNLPRMLAAWRVHLTQLGRFSDDTWRPDSPTSDWDAIVHCRGVHERLDNAIDPLDIRANRGEILTIAPENAALPTDLIDNFGKWTVPLGGGQWRLGASYEWNRTDLDPTEATRDFLLDALSNAHGATMDCRIHSHEAGLRPVSKDRRPAVGPRPGKPGHYVFNGLGTRGVLIGPRWAQHLVDGLSGDSEWDPIVHPSRLEIRH